MPLCHAAVDLAFVADDDAKMLKNAIFLLTMDSPGGYCPATYIFLESCRPADVKL